VCNHGVIPQIHWQEQTEKQEWKNLVEPSKQFHKSTITLLYIHFKCILKVSPWRRYIRVLCVVYPNRVQWYSGSQLKKLWYVVYKGKWKYGNDVTPCWPSMRKMKKWVTDSEVALNSYSNCEVYTSCQPNLMKKLMVLSKNINRTNLKMLPVLVAEPRVEYSKGCQSSNKSQRIVACWIWEEPLWYRSESWKES